MQPTISKSELESQLALKTIIQTATHFNCSEWTIRKHICFFEIKANRLKRSNLDLHHFINKTELGLYLIGLLAADGWLVQKSNRHTPHMVCLSLAEKDSYILELFDLALNKKYRKCLVKRPETQQNCYLINITSETLCSLLISYGLTLNKSKHLKFPPNFNSEELKHYLRGYFDGNGYIGKQVELSVFAPLFIKNLQHFLYNKFNLKLRQSKNGLHFKVDSRLFFKWMYLESNYHLIRKRNAAILYINE